MNRIKWAVWRYIVQVRYLVTGHCGLNCGWVKPYGFVPEADCPIHDRYEENA